MKKNITLNWAKSLLFAAMFASLQFNSTAAVEDHAISGLADSAGAYLDIGAYRPARMIVYETNNGERGAFTVFQGGSYTFGYCPERGSHYCTLAFGAGAEALASNWSHRPVRWVKERTRAEILAKRYVSKNGDYANGCVIDSMVTYERLPRTTPEANWEGLFLLFRGADELGGGHAVCIYLVGTTAWVYDPIGRQIRWLGPINLGSPNMIARKLDPSATGGWLETRDLDWLRRHGHQFASSHDQ